jgi:hypothetical protein
LATGEPAAVGRVEEGLDRRALWKREEDEGAASVYGRTAAAAVVVSNWNWVGEEISRNKWRSSVRDAAQNVCRRARYEERSVRTIA